jgi:uncharacterized cofD-like protein
MSTSTKFSEIVVIGGGTGSFTVLTGLKRYTNSITALVNMADDGGSTGQLRDELGILPPGDVRQCLVALSDSPHLRELFTYRFSEGSLSGHSFGNLFLSAVQKMTLSFDSAVEFAREVLQIEAHVVPVTNDDTRLVLEWEDGKRIKGEFKIGHLDFKSRSKPALFLEPHATIHPRAVEAIKNAKLIVIAPGNLYGSIAPALIVDGMRKALQDTDAKVVYVSNLVTKPGQTDGFKVHDLAAEIERFAGDEVLDYVLFNTDEPSKAVMDRYAHDGEYVVEFDLEQMRGAHYEAIGYPMLSRTIHKTRANDPIAATRTLIRHDPDALARQIMRLYFA